MRRAPSTDRSDHEQFVARRWLTAVMSPACTLPAQARAVLAAIYVSMDGAGNGAFPGIDELARRTGLGVRQVKTHLAAARAAGWVRSTRDWSQGRGGRTAYTPSQPMPDQVRSAAPSDADDVQPVAPSRCDQVLSVAPSQPTTRCSPASRLGAVDRPLVSTIVRFDSPSSPPTAVADGGAGASGDDDIDNAIPDDRRALLAALRADGLEPQIVETFLRPMLRTLAVPPGKDGLTYLRQLRDQAAAAGDISTDALTAACRRFETDRVRDLPWPKDIIPALQAAQAALNIVLKPGDPRWAAWLAHDRRQPGKAQYATWVERQRGEYLVRAPWPPASPEVTGGELGLWTIPWGTPEHAAHLAAWRREGPDGAAKAQAADISKRDLIEPSRWPVLVAPAPPGSKPTTPGRAP